MTNEELVRLIISKMDYKYDSITEKDKDYLLKIEEAITQIFERENAAKELLTNNHLSINSIALKTEIARQTIYNHTILRTYIEYRSKEFEDIDVSSNYADMVEKYQILNKRVEQMQVRDFEIEEMKIEIKNLKSKITDRDKEIERLKQFRKSINN
jgi:hypothetical protein